MPSAIEELLAMQLRSCKLDTGMVREHLPAKPRRWRVDFAWPDRKLAVEVEGGAWIGGRHTRGVGFGADCEKYAELTVAGWTVLRVTGRHVKTGQALQWIEQAMALRT